MLSFFFFNDTATTEIYTLSLHDALPICLRSSGMQRRHGEVPHPSRAPRAERNSRAAFGSAAGPRESRTNVFAWQCFRSLAVAFRRRIFGRAASHGFLRRYGSAGKFRGQGCPMKCNTVRTKLAGYFDDAVTGGARVEERVQIRQHLEGCGVCRQELERFRKLAVMLSRVPKNIPPADLAVRIKVAAA